MLRAAGLKMDARKDAPYSSYDKFDFEVPVRTENDVYARYQVRIEEMRQSARIVRRRWTACRRAVEGRFSARGAARPRQDEDADGALIYHFKIVTEGFRVPKGKSIR